MPTDLYKEATNHSREEVVDAQKRLVTITVGLAIKELYAHVREQGKKIKNPTVVLDPERGDRVRLALFHQDRPCETADETMDALISACDSQYDLVLAYNQLAEKYKFDLSIKTAGEKKPEAILAKNIRDKDKDSPERDYIRVTAISSDLQILESFEKKHSAKIDEHNRDNNHKTRYYKDKGWKLTNRAHLQRVVYKEIGGIGAELFLAPRDQAQIASRVTHKYFDVVRSWDEYDNDLTHPADKRKTMIEQYNTVTRVMTKVLDSWAGTGQIPNAIWRETNEMLATGDASTSTIDVGSEINPLAAKGEGKKSIDNGHQDYSPIFNSPEELGKYTKYLLDMSKKLGLTDYRKLLAPLTESDTDQAIEDKIQHLVPFAQMTHTCYMRHAPENFRTLWAACGVIANNKAKGKPTIALPLIEDITQGYGKEAGAPLTKDQISDEIQSQQKIAKKRDKINSVG